MARLNSFVRLDFITVKPYFTVKNLLIYAIIALFITAVSENFTSGICLGMFIAINFVSYPFAVGEKSNMDALYATLSADRGLVVFGRYIFALALNLSAALFFFLIGALGMLAAQIIGIRMVIGNPLVVITTVFALVIVIQSIQLPLYFRLGYTKAKFFSMVPYIAIMVGFVVFTTMANNNRELSVYLAYGFEKAMILAPILALALIPVVFLSYKLSLMFYNRREF